MSHPVTVVLDWDDTLVGWKKFGAEGEWLPGALEAISEFLTDGYAVVIASCRIQWDGGLEELTAKLESGLGMMPFFCSDRTNMPAGGTLAIWVGSGKPLGSIYVDDRGLQFDNDWLTAAELVRERTPKP